MKNMMLISVMLIFAALSGCSATSTIQKASESKSHFDDAVYEGETNVVNSDISNKDAYRIFHQAATGFISIQTIRNSAEKRANDFCKRSGKEMHALSERTSTPPHILGNFPRIEIVFVCKVSSNSPNTAKSPGKYEQLKKLKLLLDDGALTKKEYDLEKAKLLSK